MKTQILSALRNADTYVSGQMLCESFGISRTAVWKYVNQLRDEGYVLDSVPNRGYRIIDYPDIVTASEIESRLLNADGKMKGIFNKIVYFEETDSTNNQAKLAAAKKGDESLHGTLYIAERQTGGRGRRGRHWVSPTGSGIWMSLLLQPKIKPEKASMLTIVAALAVMDVVQTVSGGISCGIKWPNDIVMNGKKITGILTEMSSELDYIHYVVVGIGINVNITEIDPSIRDIATSVYLETGRKVKRSDMVAAFSETFLHYYNDFVQTGDLSLLVDRYNERLVNAGRDVKAVYADGEIVGKALGINAEGELIIQREDSQKITVRSGEVSVRGLYGYV